LFIGAFHNLAASAISHTCFLIFGKHFVFVSTAETNEHAIAEFRAAGFAEGGA